MKAINCNQVIKETVQNWVFHQSGNGGRYVYIVAKNDIAYKTLATLNVDRQINFWSLNECSLPPSFIHSTPLVGGAEQIEKTLSYSGFF